MWPDTAAIPVGGGRWLFSTRSIRRNLGSIGSLSIQALVETYIQRIVVLSKCSAARGSFHGLAENDINCGHFARKCHFIWLKHANNSAHLFL